MYNSEDYQVTGKCNDKIILNELDLNFKCCKTRSYYFCKGCYGFFHPGCLKRFQNATVLEKPFIYCSKKCQNKVNRTLKSTEYSQDQNKEVIRNFESKRGTKDDTEEKNYNEGKENKKEHTDVEDKPLEYAFDSQVLSTRERGPLTLINDKRKEKPVNMGAIPKVKKKSLEKYNFNSATEMEPLKLINDKRKEQQINHKGTETKVQLHREAIKKATDKRCDMKNKRINKFDNFTDTIAENTFRIYYQNANGLRTKGKLFYENVSNVDYDCIALSETWLTEDSEEIFPDHYRVFRQDRNYRILRVTKGGGVLLAFKSSISCSIIKQSSEKGLDEIWCLIRFGRNELIVGCVYIPSGYHLVSYATFCKSVKDLKAQYREAKFILIGDFNLPEISWTVENGSMVAQDHRSGKAKRLVDTMSSLNLQQYNHVLNVKKRILDLIYSDKFLCNQIVECDSPLTNIDWYHPPIEATFVVS